MDKYIEVILTSLKENKFFFAILLDSFTKKLNETKNNLMIC